MGNRCPDCNKFVGLEAAEPEPDQVEIQSASPVNQETGEQSIEVGGQVRLVLNCSDCGTEMAEANPDVEADFEFVHANPGCGGEVEIGDIDSMETDDYRPPGRPMRYQKHYYGADLTINLNCPECGAEATVHASVEEQAGFFDELT